MDTETLSRIRWVALVAMAVFAAACTQPSIDWRGDPRAQSRARQDDVVGEVSPRVRFVRPSLSPEPLRQREIRDSSGQVISQTAVDDQPASF